MEHIISITLGRFMHKIRHSILCFAALVMAAMLLAHPALAQKFPRPTGLVNDFGNVLSGNVEQKLEGVLLDLRQKTGAEIAVVTVADMGGMDENSYAVELFQQWGIGSKDKNDGLLILVAVEERRIRIEVGYGLEGIITDARAGQIRDQYMVPALKQNDYNTGIANGALIAAQIIAEDKGVELGIQSPVRQRGTRSGRRGSPCANLLSFIIMMIVFIILSSSRGGRGLLMGMMLGSMMGGRGRHYGGSGFGGGFGGGGFGGGFGGGMSGGGGASGGF